MRGGRRKVRVKVAWMKLELGFHKFNVDGVPRGKLGPASIRGIVHDDRGRMFFFLFISLNLIV